MAGIAVSFVISECVMLGILVGGAALIVFRRRISVLLATVLLLFSAFLAWSLSPECGLIPDADVAVLDPSIETAPRKFSQLPAISAAPEYPAPVDMCSHGTHPAAPFPSSTPRPKWRLIQVS